MRLVLHDGVGRQVEDSAQRVSDAGRRRLVACRFVPDGYNVLLMQTKQTGLSAEVRRLHVTGECDTLVCYWIHLEAY